MKQLGLGLNVSTKRTRKREFLEEMERVVPWTVLVDVPGHLLERHNLAVDMLRFGVPEAASTWFGLKRPRASSCPDLA